MVDVAQARTVLVVTLLQSLMNSLLLWHSLIAVSFPSQSTPARATGRSLNKTCNIIDSMEEVMVMWPVHHHHPIHK